jgi:hypothetical protein
MILERRYEGQPRMHECCDFLAKLSWLWYCVRPYAGLFNAKLAWLRILLGRIRNQTESIPTLINNPKNRLEKADTWVCPNNTTCQTDRSRGRD